MKIYERLFSPSHVHSLLYQYLIFLKSEGIQKDIAATSGAKLELELMLLVEAIHLLLQSASVASGGEIKVVQPDHI